METTPTTGVQAAIAAHLATETLTGDLRDALLTQLRTMGETPWSKLSERDQSWRIDSLERFAETLVRRAMAIVAHHGFPHLDVRVSTKGKYDADGIDLTAKATFTLENLMRLGEHKGGSAILVLTDVGEFFGQRRAARAEPDQRGMPFDDAGEGGSDTTDLATAAGAGSLIDTAPDLIGLTFDLAQYAPEDRDAIRTKVLAKGGRVFESADTPEAASVAEVEEPETAATDEPDAETLPKTAKRARRQIRETEAA